MTLEILHDKSTIFNFLKNNLGFQLYLVGDLDDFFLSKTIWFSLKENHEIKSIALLYVGMDIPTILLFSDKDSDCSKQLLKQIRSYLPFKFNAHLTSGLIDVFGKHNVLDYYGLDYKMVLTKSISEIDDNNIRRLNTNDISIITKLFSISYPNNWFDSRMIETDKYFGYFINDKLVGVAGIHVYSEKYKVAALGNIATHPDYRNQQIAYKLTSALCFDLQKSVNTIGLNVRSDNSNAIKCYTKIGFEIIGSYDECLIKNEYNE